MTIALCFKVIIGPKNDWHKVVGGNEFSLGRASDVDLLFGGRINGHAFTKRHAASHQNDHAYQDVLHESRQPTIWRGREQSQRAGSEGAQWIRADNESCELISSSRLHQRT
jgi:hypothetical protein